MKKISYKESLKLKDIIYIDTRSPKEFELDNIPSSINLPILDNEERKAVGTLYKKDQSEAIELGYGYYNKKLRKIVEQINKIDKNKTIIVYCFRGGMRSGTITKLVEEQGHKTYQLEGGYKAYRAYVRKELKDFKYNFRFIVLNGLAGCAKTDLIRGIKPSIDLEGLAGHRSSIFGGIGLSPKTQKNFETNLLLKLKSLKSEKFVFIEGESHKVGKVFVPNNLFSEMKKGIQVMITSPIEKRVEIIKRDYFTHGEDAKIYELINSLKKNLPKEIFKKIIDSMDKKDYKTVSRLLLEEYYDSRYIKSMPEKKPDYNIENISEKESIKKLLEIKESLQK